MSTLTFVICRLPVKQIKSNSGAIDTWLLINFTICLWHFTCYLKWLNQDANKLKIINSLISTPFSYRWILL